jgi:hypothetical protein
MPVPLFLRADLTSRQRASGMHYAFGHAGVELPRSRSAARLPRPPASTIADIFGGFMRANLNGLASTLLFDDVPSAAPSWAVGLAVSIQEAGEGP